MVSIYCHTKTHPKLPPAGPNWPVGLARRILSWHELANLSRTQVTRKIRHQVEFQTRKCDVFNQFYNQNSSSLLIHEQDSKQCCSTRTSQEHSSPESRECECTRVILIVRTVCIAYSLPLIKKHQTWQQHPVVWLVFIKAKNNSTIRSIIISLFAEFCRHLLGSVWQASCAWVCVCGSGIQGFLLKPPVWLSLPPNSTSSAKNSYSVAATRKTN